MLHLLRTRIPARSFSRAPSPVRPFLSVSTRFHATAKMSSTARSTPTPAPAGKKQYPLQKPKTVIPKRQVRILMLHGYTQSGPLFRAKTRAVEKLLAKTLAPLDLVPILLYPTGPSRLSPRDVPGFVPSSKDAASSADAETDAWAWFRWDDGRGTYNGLDDGMRTLAAAMAEVTAQGEVVDGVIGFSQGAAMASMLVAAMDPDRTVGAEEDEGWVRAVREANGGQPFKFAVLYSGFYALPERLQWVYQPKVRTPTLHFLGSLDTVVDESRTRGLVDRCQGPLVVVHPGGHYVPVNREWVMPLAGFVRKCLEDKA
ncbi:serine hydrolase-domain-containing protein [Lasiosphaeria hispida]|uniref:Serine hydrolase-domain-containing protein n=1 Tax=Lasiosphaeria hispida TaxID=260671 RepID=A0AAJ0H7G7_9PEZI|nr:serine hydrolase-domain-containing protein [Lasiosphaeria hispida]